MLYTFKNGHGASGKEYEWWKFFRNPNVNFDEFKFINEKSSLSQNVAFVFSDEINLENNNVKMRDVDALAVTDQIFNIWDLKLTLVGSLQKMKLPHLKDLLY